MSKPESETHPQMMRRETLRYSGTVRVCPPNITVMPTASRIDEFLYLLIYPLLLLMRGGEAQLRAQLEYGPSLNP